MHRGVDVNWGLETHRPGQLSAPAASPGLSASPPGPAHAQAQPRSGGAWAPKTCFLIHLPNGEVKFPGGGVGLASLPLPPPPLGAWPKSDPMWPVQESRLLDPQKWATHCRRL